MPDAFNFRTCCELLKTNPKTFHRWLDKARIEPQENPADPRERLVVKADVITLAQRNGRTLPDWFSQEEAEPLAPITLAEIAEQVERFQQQTIPRFDQTDRAFARIEALLLKITSKQHEPPTVPDAVSTLQIQTVHRFDQIEQSLFQLTTMLQDIASSHHKEPQVAPPVVTQESVSYEADQVQHTDVAPTSPTPASRSSQKRSQQTPSSSSGKAKRRSGRAKKTSKGKPLPRTMIPLRVFAEQHHISLKVAETAGKHGKLTIQQGRWLYQSRYITKALRTQGQQEFYEYFHAHEGFTACEQCPHASFSTE